MPTIRLEQVSKSYRGKHRYTEAVIDINLTIGQGEFVFFIGSRGAGKSTLLDIIAGITKPDRGEVFLEETNLYRASPWRRAALCRCMGRVPQDSELVRTRTLFDNLASARRLGPFANKKQKEKLEQQIQKALSLVGLAGCEQRYPLEFSISECRRIELAKAILNSPPILLLDEFTYKMDDDMIWDMMHLFNEMNARGTTILMSTNASMYVNIMRKRVVTLADGRIVGDMEKGKYGFVR